MARLFEGPDLAKGAESLQEHTRRLGPIPALDDRFIATLARTGISGRGGASFPVAAKWQAVARHARRDVAILVNGAEGEPLSKKDRALMTTRPHLILDGAFVTARVLGGRRVVVYIGERHSVARSAMRHAVEERQAPERGLVSFAVAPARYIAGQETAAIHLINEGIATPTTMPPYPFEHGIDRMPTLVHNVETLAQIAIIARTGEATGTALVTVAGAVHWPGVLEMSRTATVGDAVKLAGGSMDGARAVLIGGYFGSWVDAGSAANLPLDAGTLRTHGLNLGCGVIGVLTESRCPVCEVAGMMRYLASESSAQCGPCFFGLRALSEACIGISERGSNHEDLRRLHRWAVDVSGRGACRHPDGAVTLLQSAMKTFAHEFATHTPHEAIRQTGAA